MRECRVSWFAKPGAPILCISSSCRAVQPASLWAWPPVWSEAHTSGCCMLECSKRITMFPRVGRQDVCRQSAICRADKIWNGSRPCYVGCFSWNRSSTERDISFFTKDTIIFSVPLLQICRLLRGPVRRYKSSSKHRCQDLLLCEELFCLLHACLVWWLSGDVSMGNAYTKSYARQGWWQKSS